MPGRGVAEGLVAGRGERTAREARRRGTCSFPGARSLLRGTLKNVEKMTDLEPESQVLMGPCVCLGGWGLCYARSCTATGEGLFFCVATRDRLPDLLSRRSGRRFLPSFPPPPPQLLLRASLASVGRVHTDGGQKAYLQRTRASQPSPGGSGPLTGTPPPRSRPAPAPSPPFFFSTTPALPCAPRRRA